MAAVREGEAGFSQMAVRCDPRVPFATFLQVRRHRPAPTDDDETHERALFVVGMSPAWGEAEVRAIFEGFGATVETVAIHQKRTSCLVLFLEEDGVDLALQQASPGQVVEVDLSQLDGEEDAAAGDGDEEGGGVCVGGGGKAPSGLRAWVAEHRALRPGRDALQKQLDDWMTAFDKAEAEAEEARLAAEQEDDGWTVVGSHKGRKKTTSGSGVTVGGVSAAAAERKRGKQAKLQNDFYRFQQREQRRSELLNLRKKFEDDKKKIAQLKASRKFKPY